MTDILGMHSSSYLYSLGSLEECSSIFLNKLQKHTYTYNSPKLPAEMNTSGSKTSTTFIPFKQFMIAGADYEVSLIRLSKFCKVPCTIQCYDHCAWYVRKKNTFWHLHHITSSLTWLFSHCSVAHLVLHLRFKALGCKSHETQVTIWTWTELKDIEASKKKCF